MRARHFVSDEHREMASLEWSAMYERFAELEAETLRNRPSASEELEPPPDDASNRVPSSSESRSSSSPPLLSVSSRRGGEAEREIPSIRITLDSYMRVPKLDLSFATSSGSSSKGLNQSDEKSIDLVSSARAGSGTTSAPTSTVITPRRDVYASYPDVFPSRIPAPRSNTFDVGKGESRDHESSLDEMDESIADLSLSVIKAPDSEVDMSHQVTLTIDEFHDGVSQYSEEQSSFRAFSESSVARKAQSDLALPRKLSSDLHPSEEDDFDATYADDVKQRMKIWQIVRAILREIDELPGSQLLNSHKHTLEELLQIHEKLFEEEQELTRIEFGLLLEQHMYVKRLRQIEALGCRLRWDQPDLNSEKGILLQAIREITYQETEEFRLVNRCPDPS